MKIRCIMASLFLFGAVMLIFPISAIAQDKTPQAPVPEAPIVHTPNPAPPSSVTPDAKVPAAPVPTQPPTKPAPVPDDVKLLIARLQRDSNQYAAQIEQIKQYGEILTEKKQGADMNLGARFTNLRAGVNPQFWVLDPDTLDWMTPQEFQAKTQGGGSTPIAAPTVAPTPASTPNAPTTPKVASKPAASHPKQ